NDSTAMVWDVATGETLHTFTGHNAAVFNVDFSPDDQILATSGGDNNILLWDLETGEMIGEPLTGHTAGAVSVAFTADGQRLVSSGADSTVRVWDVESGQQLQVFGNHSGLVPQAEFAPDGQMLASGDATGVAIIWDLSEAVQPLGQAIDGQQTAVNKLSFDPGGQLLASAGADSTIRMWDVSEGIHTGRILTHALRINEPILALDFNSQGSLLASGSRNGTAMVWDVASGQAITNAISAAVNGVSSLAIGDDDQTLVIGGNTGFGSVWDLATGQLVGGGLSGHAGPVTEVAISPDSQTVASGGAGGTVIIRPMEEIASGQAQGTILTYTMSADAIVTSLAFSPESGLLASGDNLGNLALWGVSEVQLDRIVTTLAEGITDLAFDPAGTVLAVGDESGRISLWETDEWQTTGGGFLGPPSGISALAFDSSGETLTAGGIDGSWITYEISSGNVLDQGQLADFGETVVTALSGNGVVARGNQDSQVHLSELGQDGNLNELLHHDAPMMAGVTVVAHSPDGSTLASSGGDGAVVLWDAETFEPLAEPWIGHTAAVVNLIFSPDGRRVATGSCAAFHPLGGCTQGEVILWDVAAGEIVRVITDTVGFSQALAFSPDGNVLSVNDCIRVEVAGVCVEAAVKLFEVETGAPLQTLEGHSAFVWTADFSPDGTILATGSVDTNIILWDAESGEPIGNTLSNHGGWVRRVSFSPDGARLASAGFDNLVILWDVASGQPIGGPLAAYTNNAMDAQFSPDGLTVASASLDDSITLSDVSLESWRERACRIANRNMRPEEWTLFFGELPFRETCP
ncbi:MAG: WD40 repeat domain-containing protein, partial [Chloroflexota bacterium]